MSYIFLVACLTTEMSTPVPAAAFLSILTGKDTSSRNLWGHLVLCPYGSLRVVLTYLAWKRRSGNTRFKPEAQGLGQRPN